MVGKRNLLGKLRTISSVPKLQEVTLKMLKYILLKIEAQLVQ